MAPLIAALLALGYGYEAHDVKLAIAGLCISALMLGVNYRCRLKAAAQSQNKLPI